MAKNDKTRARGRPAISEQKLKGLLRSQKSRQDDVDEIVSGMGAEVKVAVDKHHLNKKIFGWLKQLDKMEPEKLAMMLDDLDHYLDISGLDDRAAKVQNLDLEATDAAEGEAEDETGEPKAGRKGNVKAFPRPAAQAAE